MEMALCYEIHGRQGRYFNLISEPCLSVNAHYMLQDPDKPLHFIDEIGVVAINEEGTAIQMKIDRHCNLFVNGSATNTVFLNSSGVLAEAIPQYNDVVIVTRGSFCGSENETVLWVQCRPRPHGLMELHVARDLFPANYSSHGLLGQPHI